MLWSGFTANIMSLGGIALAIGAMVDSSIILVENAHKRLEGRDTRLMSSAERRTIISDALVEVGRPLFFSLLVITVSFLPIFALEDREGRLFKPLAFTKTVSMAWACVLAVTLTPALAILFLKGRFVEEQRHAVSRFLHKAYGPIVDWSLRHRYSVASTAAALALVSVPVYLSIPSEFMPALAEGSVLYMPTAVPGMSIDTAASVIQQQNRIIRTVPEVEHVFGKAGRSTSATDPAPLSMFETVITLKPKEQWREGISFESIIAELNGKLDLPGMPNIWWMPIQTRIEMLSTGVRTAVGVKILGDSLEDIAKTAEAIETVLRKVPGTKSAFAERVALGQSIEIDIDRSLAAMYGLDIASIHSLIEAAVGGRQASTFFSGRERYAITVRYQRDARDSLAALDDLALFAPDGRLVKLSQIAAIRVKHGPAMIASENAKLLGFVFVDVAPHVGLAEYVASARSAVSQAVTLPQQTSLVWSGQFESLQRARATLIWIIPLTLALIIFLLYMNTRSATETAIILAAVPFSLLGAFLLIKVLGYKISVASWVGILALAGLDAETGVVMMMYLSQAWNGLVASGRVIDTKALLAAIHEGAVRRVRPKLMTVAATLMGLLPVMWSQGTGAEVMKRIAAPMVGGMVTSAVLELLVYPALFYIWKSRALPPVPNAHPESNKARG
jgi:Cu(I)/Ag(I) efflux system membrane protein CusA/SilA